jgi:hypothetical protein
MANRKRSVALGVALTALLALPGSAVARTAAGDPHHPQTPAAPAAAPAGGTPMMGMMGQGMMGQGMPMMGMMARMGEMRAMMAGRVEGRIAFLKAELKITEAQQKLWDTVAEAIRARAKAMPQMAMPGGMGAGPAAATLPQKLAARDKALTARLEALRKYQAALNPLYAAFSDDQKKAADELLAGPMGMMGMGTM